MKTVAVLASGVLAAAAGGQVITTPGITANFGMSWIEDPVNGGNNNGRLESGESALIFTSFSFTGQFTRVDFAPAIGSFTSGTILGLAAAFLDISGGPGDAGGLYNNGVTSPPSSSIGPNANTAGTFGYGVRGGWRLGGNTANGSASSNGFVNIGPGQLPSDPSFASTANPISNLNRLGWTPNSYAHRDVFFSVHPSAVAGANAVGLYVDLNGVLGGVVYVPLGSVSFGRVQVMYVPGPGTLALLAFAGPLVKRRRRPRERPAD